MQSRASAFTGAFRVGVAGDTWGALGHLYQQAAHQLGARELRGFLLHQAEWLLHIHDASEATRIAYLEQTSSYLHQLLALDKKPRVRVAKSKIAPIGLVDE